MVDFIEDPEELILIIGCFAGGIGLIAYGLFINNIHLIIIGLVVLAFGILFLIIVLVFGGIHKLIDKRFDKKKDLTQL